MVERELIHLEVAGVEHRTGLGADEHGQRIGDRMGDRVELEVEDVQGHLVAFLDGVQLGMADAVFAQLALDQSQGQLAAIDGDVLAHAQQIGHAPDVVLMAMGEHQPDDIAEATLQVVEAGQDQVNTGLVVLREQHPAIDQQDLAIDLETGHVAPDITQSSEGNDAQGVSRQL